MYIDVSVYNVVTVPLKDGVEFLPAFVQRHVHNSRCRSEHRMSLCSRGLLTSGRSRALQGGQVSPLRCTDVWTTKEGKKTMSGMLTKHNRAFQISVLPKTSGVIYLTPCFICMPLIRQAERLSLCSPVCDIICFACLCSSTRRHACRPLWTSSCHQCRAPVCLHVFHM